MTDLTTPELLLQLSLRFLPVWACMAVILTGSIATRRKTGLYGQIFDSPIGVAGFSLVLFWVLTALFANQIITHDPYGQFSGMKNALPGSAIPGADEDTYSWYLLGGDNLARDVFSRMVSGSRIVLTVSPIATVFAFLVGITLGLPAGYYGGRMDTALTFAANLIIAFPVILLFYLLVTPEIRAGGPAISFGAGHVWQASVPNVLAAIVFIFPMIFFCLFWHSRFYVRPVLRNVLVAITLGIGVWVYLGTAFDYDPTGIFRIEPGLKNIFAIIAVVGAPAKFRIVRGQVLDIKTRDFVAAAQTRGERPWYIMLWEILPNARGPLIVDFGLRIGYTAILLGALGFFGLGLTPESPDWGTTINEGRKFLALYAHPALAPALALMSLVLGLNLLGDTLREESLKD
ncbi:MULTISPECIES: ABC transporter permease [Phaeobacter]|uniref:ABC transporter permease n=1 Tax=Phaeobacter TaxID=302485 RepID=UPI003A864575